MSTEQQYDLYSQEFRKHAYQTFEQMRNEGGIIRQVGLDGETPIWYVSRYEDVDTILRDDKRFVLDWRMVATSEQLAELEKRRFGVTEMFNDHLLTKEGEDHRRLRALVSKVFTPRIVSEMRPRIQAVADELLDQVQPRGSMDLVDSYAFPLPIIVIGELLGIPSEDRDKFRVWSDTMVTPALTPEAREQFRVRMMEFVGYLANLFEERRQHPRQDLISGLIQAEEEGDRLNTQELFSMLMLLIIAGHETTVTLIGNATVAMLTHPQVFQRLKAHPEQMPRAVEEFLRYDPPVERAMTRWVAEDVVVGGQQFKRGQLVILLLGSANHDPEAYAHPEQLDIDRENKNHLAFGRGVHYCLGAPLARLEGEIALNTLLRRLPDLRLAVSTEELEYRLAPLFHAFTHIPVEWDE